MKTHFISTLAAAILLTGRPAIAQNAAKGDNEPPGLAGPLVSKHFSVARVDAAPANAQAIVREMADTLGGNFEQAVMTATRSSFLASWKPVSGATGYRVDVSTSPAFDSYINNYRDLDVGNATSSVISGLTPATQYYGALLISNDDWRDTQEGIISGTGLAPANDLESAIAGTVAPGSYTAIVRGYENATGNALVEVYGLN